MRQLNESRTAETAGDNELGFHEQEERIQGYCGNENECNGREQKTTVVKSEALRSASRRESYMGMSTYALPKNSTPVPMKDLRSYNESFNGLKYARGSSLP